jgi:hypothetical protein
MRATLRWTARAYAAYCANYPCLMPEAARRLLKLGCSCIRTLNKLFTFTFILFLSTKCHPCTEPRVSCIRALNRASHAPVHWTARLMHPCTEPRVSCIRARCIFRLTVESDDSRQTLSASRCPRAFDRFRNWRLGWHCCVMHGSHELSGHELT